MPREAASVVAKDLDRAPKPQRPQPKLFWSQAAKTFFSDDIHSADQIPGDAVLLRAADYQALVDGRAAGQDIAIGPEGAPVLVPRTYTAEVQAANVRASRDEALRDSDILTRRHQEQVAIGRPTTLTEEQHHALLVYRDALRELPAAPGFPDVSLPAHPLAAR